MIRWNKTRKKILIIFSSAWIILILGGSFHIYPGKRNDNKLGEKELVGLFKKENKTHEENIAVLSMLRKENNCWPVSLRWLAAPWPGFPLIQTPR